MRGSMNTDGVVRVGNGRGFVMEHRVYFDFGDGNGYRKLRRKVVVTASHCLPHAPKVMSSVDYQLATYAKLDNEPTRIEVMYAFKLSVNPRSERAAQKSRVAKKERKP